MREILFRAKRPFGWNPHTHFYDIDRGWVYGFLTSQGKFISAINSIDVFTATVGQYTGIKDKNGKRIFEGDIIQESAEEPLYDGLYRVKWDKYGLGWQADCPVYTRGIGGYAKDLFKFILPVVVGNIYDNPKLLENVTDPNAPTDNYLQEEDE
jgi:uncharacterized phage protein (TIGR01671 family)